MNTAACYLVAVLHSPDAVSDDPPRDPVPVHLFALPAGAVDARESAGTNRMEAAAGLVFELATTPPDRLPSPWASISRPYHAAGLRPFRSGDVMVVLPPGGATTALRYDDHGWQHLDRDGTGTGC